MKYLLHDGAIVDADAVTQEQLCHPMTRPIEEVGEWLEVTPAKIRNAIAAFLQMWPNAEWGGAHIVLSDYNLGDASIDFCLNELDGSDHPADEIEATRRFLVWLKSTPLSMRESEA